MPVNQIRQGAHGRSRLIGTAWLIYRKSPLQPGLAVMQHDHIKILPGEGSGGAGKNPIELRTVESDQQQIDAGIKRLDDGRTDIVVVDRAHH